MPEFGRPLIVVTETGSVYEVTDQTLKRMHVGKASQPLRQDGDTLQIVQWILAPKMGCRMWVGLKPLEPHESGVVVTYRLTSRVVNIEEKTSDTLSHSVSH